MAMNFQNLKGIGENGNLLFKPSDWIYENLLLKVSKSDSNIFELLLS